MVWAWDGHVTSRRVRTKGSLRPSLADQRLRKSHRQPLPIHYTPVVFVFMRIAENIRRIVSVQLSKCGRSHVHTYVYIHPHQWGLESRQSCVDRFFFFFFGIEIIREESYLLSNLICTCDRTKFNFILIEENVHVYSCKARPETHRIATLQASFNRFNIYYYI